ncbi:MAG: prepilin peptidase, partial [Bdellovibrionales bacterium]
MDMDLINIATLVLAAFIMILAAISDAMRFKIPNLACLALLLLFPAYGLSHATPLPWKEHLTVFAVVLFVGYTLYIKKWAGAGDIKLIAVISLWAGPHLWAPCLFIVAISGGLLSVVI